MESLFSVVIPVYNAEHTLTDCLNSLLNQQGDLSFEVILVNNCSTDRTLEIASGYPFRIVHENRQGVSFARNRGIQEARGKWIAFLDSDCIAAPDWLVSFERKVKDNPAMIIGGGYLDAAPPQNIFEEYAAKRMVLSQERVFMDAPCSPPFFLTANMLVRKDLALEIGGFDPKIDIGEDADFCWRIRKIADGEFSLVDQAVAQHRHRSSLRALIRQTFLYGYGNTLLFQKYHKEFGCSIFFSIRPYLSTGFALVRLPFTLLFGRKKIGKIYPLFDIISNLSFISGKLYGSWINKVLVF